MKKSVVVPLAALALMLGAQSVLAQGRRRAVLAPLPGYTVQLNAPSDIPAGTSALAVFSFTVVDPAINSLTLSLAPQQGGVTITPSAQTTTRAAGFPPLTYTIAVASNVAPGPVTIAVASVVNGGVRTDNFSFTLKVPAPLASDFTLTVAPPSVALSAGETRTVTVSTAPVPAQFNQRAATDVVVTITAPAGVTVTPQSFSLSVPGTQSVAVSVSPLISGRFPLTVTATSGQFTHTAPAIVQILPADTIIVPSSVTAPSLSTTLRVAGTNFSSGGTFVSASPDVVVERTIVYNPQLADVVVSVPERAAIGPHRLDFRNADGAVSVRAGTLYVVPAGGIGAPLGVTTAAIVYPVDGTIVGDDEALYPRGMLATSGTGTISGTWSIDGVPFDRFTATASAGPVEVRTHVPVPHSAWGAHRISLVVDTPRLAVAPAVSYTAARESVTRLTFYEPLDRAVVERAPRIRWSLVPGATAYELELRNVAENGAESGGTRIRTTQSAWAPAANVTGMKRFRVRAIFPGDVRGEPTPWSTAVFLPGKASLHIDDAAGRRVAWSGGTPGMIYRVEFQRAGARCFEALTFTPEYRLPAGIAWRDCDAVRVRAVAPSGTFLGESEPRHLAAGFAPPATLARTTPPFQVVEQEPRAKTTVPARTAIAVRWRDGDERDAALLVDGVDVTAVAVRQSRDIRYEALLPLRAGRHVAALAMPAGVSEWSFTAEEPPAPAAAAPPALTYVVSPSGSITWAHPPTSGHGAETFALSSQGSSGDVNAGSGAALTGNLNYNGTSDPSHLGQASHDWVAEGRTARPGLFGSTRIGYIAPDFTDASKYLVSTAHTGVIARAGTDFGTVSYYEPIEAASRGLLSSTAEQRVRGLALATPEGRPYVVRLVDLDFGTAGATARTYGLFARWAINDKAQLIGEVARGTFNDLVTSQRGNAVRLAFSGTAAATTYSLGISKVDPDFVSPANRVFTAGFNNRVDTDLSLSRTFGKAAFTLVAAHYAQGRANDTPRGTKNAASLGMISPLSARVALDVSAGFTRDSAETTTLLPLGTDRAESRAATKLTETFTRIAVTQEMKWSRTNDRAEPANDVTTNELTMSAAGSLTTNFNLTSLAGFTRTKSSPLLGTTDHVTLTLTPSIAVPKLLIALRPSIAIDRSTTDVTDTRTHSEVYGTTIEWAPPWMQSLLSGQLGATLTRMTDSALPARTQTRAATASVTVHTKKTRGMPMFAATPPPGTVPPAPPEATTTTPEPAPPQG